MISAFIKQLVLMFQVKMVVFRDEGAVSGKEEELMDMMEVELTKKPGKGLGLSIVGRKNGTGIFISDVVSIMWPSLLLKLIMFLIFLQIQGKTKVSKEYDADFQVQ